MTGDASIGTRPRRSRLAWWAALLVAMVAAALWTYALWGPRSAPPGTLDETGRSAMLQALLVGEPTFATTAEARCAVALEAILALPAAHETTDADERADVLDTANQLLEAQIADLAAVAPQRGDDAARVDEWLTDWAVYLDDRRSYADRLREDPSARLLETERGGDHISEALAFFADINAMPSCAPPGDA